MEQVTANERLKDPNSSLGLGLACLAADWELRHDA